MISEVTSMKDVKKQAPLKTAVEPKVKNGIKVHVIEDEKALVDALVYNLDREGYEVTVAHDGQDGLRKAQAIPDIILLDIMLPGINGIEILRELRGNEKTKSIPVIVVSAKSEETDQVVGFSMGADDYVTKPFSPRELVARIKAILKRSSGSGRQTLLRHGRVSLLRCTPIFIIRAVKATKTNDSIPVTLPPFPLTLAKVMHENTAPLTLTRLGLHVRQGALNRLRPIANARLSHKASRRREKRLRLIRITSGGNGGSGGRGGGGGGRKAWRVAYTRATHRLRCSRGTSRSAPPWTRHTTRTQQTPISGWCDQSATSAVHWNEELDKRRNGGRGVERGCGATRAQPQREASKTLQSYRPSSYRAIQRLFGKKTEQPQEKRNGTSEKKVS